MQYLLGSKRGPANRTVTFLNFKQIKRLNVEYEYAIAFDEAFFLRARALDKS